MPSRTPHSTVHILQLFNELCLAVVTLCYEHCNLTYQIREERRTGQQDSKTEECLLLSLHGRSLAKLQKKGLVQAEYIQLIAMEF